MTDSIVFFCTRAIKFARFTLISWLCASKSNAAMHAMVTVHHYFPLNNVLLHLFLLLFWIMDLSHHPLILLLLPVSIIIFWKYDSPVTRILTNGVQLLPSCCGVKFETTTDYWTVKAWIHMYPCYHTILLRYPVCIIGLWMWFPVVY